MIDFYLFGRIAGLGAFGLLTAQMVSGPLAEWVRKRIGVRRQMRIHIWIGLAAFGLAWLHPVFLKIARGELDGTFQSLGKAGLVLLTGGVAAGWLRTAPWLLRHWRWVHRANYVAYGLIYVHSWRLGGDVRNLPWAILYWAGPIAVGMAIYTKIRQWYISRHGNNGYV